MKKIFFLSVSTLLFFSISNAQLKRLFQKDSTGKSGLDKVIQKVPTKGAGGLTNDEVVSGLKEALELGTTGLNCTKCNSASSSKFQIPEFF